MSSQGLEVIDNTVRLTHEWINELAGRLDWGSRHDALRFLRVTLHIVRDHLLTDELAQFSAQMPLLLRGMLFEGWVPKRTPSNLRSAAQFVSAIEAGMADTQEFHGADEVKYVFELLNNRLSAGEINDVRASMPESIRAYWPAP